MFFVWDGFRILFRPFGPSREAARCTLSISELLFLFFIFILFPFFAFLKMDFVLKKILGKHTATKKGVMSSQEVDFVSRVVLVFASLFKENRWVVLLPPPSLLPSALFLSSGLWCLGGASFGGDAFSPSFGWCCFLALPLLGRCCISHPFLVWCCLGLLSGASFLLAPSFRVVLLQWCQLTVFFFIIHFSLTSVRVLYHFWKSISSKAIDQKNTKFYVPNCKF